MINIELAPLANDDSRLEGCSGGLFDHLGCLFAKQSLSLFSFHRLEEQIKYFAQLALNRRRRRRQRLRRAHMQARVAGERSNEPTKERTIERTIGRTDE